MKRPLSISTFIFASILLISCGVSNKIMTPSLMISTQDAPAGATSVAYNGKSGLNLVARGGKPPYKWSWAPARNSNLPPGLYLNGNSISGTPEVSGDFSFVVTVTDSGYPAARASAAYTVAVDAPLTITSGHPPNGTVGVGYGPIGTIYLRCVWKSTTQQVCSRCNPAISGSCPTNRTNCSYPRACTKTTQNHSGFTFTATGGAAPYTWAGTGLPPGLGLYPKLGIMSGTPTTVGTYNITLTVRDSEPTPQHVQTTYPITISASKPKYTLTGYCFGTVPLPPPISCRLIQDLADCPVGAPAITRETVSACMPGSSPIAFDSSRTCGGTWNGLRVRGYCLVTYSGAP